MNGENKKENYTTNLTGYRRAIPIIFVALAIFSAICVFSQGSGFLGNVIGRILRGLFSYGAYLIPFLLAIHALCYAEDFTKGRFVTRSFFSLTAVLAVSVSEYAIVFWNSDAVFSPSEFFSSQSAGGFIGSFIGFLSVKLLGCIGAILLSAAVLAIFATLFFADRTGEFGKKATRVADTAFGMLAKAKNGVAKKITEKKAEKAEREAEEHRTRSDELLNDQFFDVAGVEGLKIDELGIGAPTVEEQSPVEEPAPKKRRSASKPLDLNYGIENDDVKPVPETPAKDEKKDEVSPGVKYGIEDRAEEIFTKNFDPFDFATGEKIASKPSSKATFEEEIDDMSLYMTEEPKKELSAREKRKQEFEKAKQNWKARNEGSHAASAQNTTPETPASHSTSPQVTSTVPVDSVTDAIASTYISFPEDPGEHTNAKSTETVGAYTTPQPSRDTHNTPIKTVEYTFNAQAAPTTQNPPIPTATSTSTYSKPKPMGEATEDDAKLIAEKVARRDPTYARSANDLTTYTRIIPSPNDSAEASFAEALLGNDNSAVLDRTATYNEAEIAGANDSESVQSFEPSEDDQYFPAPSSSQSDTTVYEFDEDNLDMKKAAEEIAAAIPHAETDTTAGFTDMKCAEAPTVSAEDDAAEPTTYDTDGTNAIRSSYQRAAGFASVLVSDDVASVNAESPTAQFKPYQPPTTDDAIETLPHTEETLKVERAMLSPTLTSEPETKSFETSQATETAASAEPVFVPAADEPTETASSPAAIPEPQNISSPASDIADGNSPEYVMVNEDTAWSDESETDTHSDPVSVDWDAEIIEEAGEPSYYEEESADSVPEVSFVEEEAEDEDEENSDAPTSFENPPEEDDVQTEEIPPEEQNPDVLEMRRMFTCLDPIGQTPTLTVDAQDTVSETAEVPVAEATDSPSDATDDAPPFDGAVIKETPTAALIPVEEIKEEKKPKKPDYSDYEFPSIELLAKEDPFSDENIASEIQENADKLIETLASFGVTASIKGVDRGPRITRYEVVPAKGVKVSSILNLQDDIALNLAAGSIRMEAPIPGKSAVGIEIPNKKACTVRLRNLLETEDFQSQKSKTAVCIGRDVAGQPVFGDISKMPHLLIAGATGMGKSVCINALMISILYKARPDEVKFIMIDPKQVEFTMYNGIPHLLVPVVSDAKQAAGALMWAVEEMEKRYNLLNPLCVRNIEAYNEKVTADPSLGEPMSKIVIVIDEFADLMLQVKDPVENLVMRIAQKARAAGIYLVIGTQRPSVNVITGVIKANVPSRISCKVMSNVDSKTVLDSAGAEKLLDRGDMLYAPTGSPKPHRVQGAFVADAEVEAIMAHLKKFSDGANYDSTVMEEIERAAQKCSKKGGGNNDADSRDDESNGKGYLNDRQFLDAVEVAVNTGKISTALLQRKLSIGYGKAAKFLDVMEGLGIVSEPNGQRPREILITPDEWREKLARSTID